MDVVIEESARKAAASFGPQVQEQVERALLAGGRAGPARYMDLGTAASVAGAIVAVAQLAYSVYSDMRKAGATPRPPDIERRVRVRIEVEISVPLPEAKRDEVIERVVAALLDSTKGDPSP